MKDSENKELHSELPISKIRLIDNIDGVLLSIGKALCLADVINNGYFLPEKPTVLHLGYGYDEAQTITHIIFDYIINAKQELEELTQKLNE